MRFEQRRAVDHRHRAAARRRRCSASAYFDRDDAERGARSARSPSRSTAASTGRWAQPRAAAIVAWAGTPRRGFIDYDWRGYNEAMILYVLALGSPTHPVEPRGVDGVDARPTSWGTFHGQAHLGFAPLFGHQYSHVWIDFRGIQDALHARQRHRLLRELAPRHAARSARTRSPTRAAGAATAPTSGGSPPATARSTSSSTIGGEQRRFHTYAARGVGHRRRVDDGTLAPTAAGGSMPFAPEVAMPALMRDARDATATTSTASYGFLDAFNPTLRLRRVPVQHGQVVPGRRLVRHRLPRHRPGADPGDDREPPQRAWSGGRCAATRTSCAGCGAPASPAAGSTRRAR